MPRRMKFAVTKPGYEALAREIGALSAAFDPNAGDYDALRRAMTAVCEQTGWTLDEFYTEQERRH